jgi:hypothetical protein
MSIKKYKYSVSDTYLDFEFSSIGPKGKITTIVRYSPQNVGGTTYFNLAFGGLNPATGKIEEFAITDNQDREMVLATITATVLEFTRHFPDMIVFAQEIGPVRNRLSQTRIPANWDEISALLFVYGCEQNKGWQPFRQNVLHYKAFFVEQKPAKPKSKARVKDYGNDPFFVKKAEESKAFLEKHGFPKDLLPTK